jgi:hypothetical protein
MWSYTSTPQYVFMVWRLIKHRVNFAHWSQFKGDDRETTTAAVKVAAASKVVILVGAAAEASVPGGITPAISAVLKQRCRFVLM